MDHKEDIIACYKEFANKQLREQIAELKKYDSSHLVSGKLARFKMFNEHHEILKTRLNQELMLTLNRCSPRPDMDRGALETSLKALCEEYINEYLCLSFLRKKAKDGGGEGVT
jgi:hypothetical protein